MSAPAARRRGHGALASGAPDQQPNRADGQAQTRAQPRLSSAEPPSQRYPASPIECNETTSDERAQRRSHSVAPLLSWEFFLWTMPKYWGRALIYRRAIPRQPPTPRHAPKPLSELGAEQPAPSLACFPAIVGRAPYNR